MEDALGFLSVAPQRAAAPKMVRVLSWPVLPNCRVGIMERLLYCTLTTPVMPASPWIVQA